MCGIVGMLAIDGRKTVSKEAMAGMLESILKRGPDGTGFYISQPAGLAMCRLSIIDLSGGQQPISNEDGSITLVCNGEIYNHIELRRELEAKGHRFKTGSDVEVILHLYEEIGFECVNRLRGMFAFAIWDEKRRRFFCARDRLGIKPLFVAESGGILAIGSEMKALLKSGTVSKEIDWRALHQYFTLGYIPAPLTIFKGIKKLVPGHWLSWEDGKITTERYWRFESKPNFRMSEGDFQAEFLSVFRKAVKMHLMSDVPLGAFLSGGVDSSLVVALMSEMADGPVNTFTMGFGGNVGGFLDERGYARMVSQRYGTIHTEFEVEPHVNEVLEEVAGAFDEPFADDSVIPSYYICQLAGAKVKVALTGLGGDELFGGYERYLGIKINDIYRRIPSVLRNAIVAPLVNRLPELRNGHYTVNHIKRFVRSANGSSAQCYKDYVSVFGRESESSLFRPEAQSQIAQAGAGDAEAYFDSPYAQDVVDRAMYQDIHTYLPEDILALSDRLSMYHSLELRVPFLDNEVVDFCATIPASLKIKYGEKKYLLRKLARPFVPEAVLNHRKQGFASPMAAWLRTDLKDVVQAALSPARLNKHGIIDSDYVGKLFADHLSRKESNDKKIFTVLMFQKWYERMME